MLVVLSFFVGDVVNGCRLMVLVAVIVCLFSGLVLVYCSMCSHCFVALVIACLVFVVFDSCLLFVLFLCLFIFEYLCLCLIVVRLFLFIVNLEWQRHA